MTAPFLIIATAVLLYLVVDNIVARDPEEHMKLRSIIDTAAIVVIGILVAMAAGCSDGPKPPSKQILFETLYGAKLLVLEGADPQSSDAAEVDRQISRIQQIGLERGYNWPGHSLFIIELIEPDDVCVTPESPGSFLTPAGQYGSGSICVAGQFDPRTDRIRTTLAAIRTSKIIQYEAEHFGLKYNDEALYLETLTHIPCPPKCHPIFGVE